MKSCLSLALCSKDTYHQLRRYVLKFQIASFHWSNHYEIMQVGNNANNYSFLRILLFYSAFTPHSWGYEITLKDPPQSIGLLWTSDQPVAETWQHTTLKTDKHPCPDGIRTRNPSRRSAADPRLRPVGQGSALFAELEEGKYKTRFTVTGVDLLNNSLSVADVVWLWKYTSICNWRPGWCIKEV
jgi:hypothetical protein